MTDSKITLPSEVRSERLVLKRHRPNRATEFFEAIDANRDHLSAFLPWVSEIKTIEDERTYLASVEKKWNEGTLFDFGVFFEGIVVGNMGAFNLNSHGGCEMGYWLTSSAQGKGLMTEAVTALENVLFKAGIHRIEIRCDTKNSRSSNIPKRLGYDLEGHLKEDTLTDGVYHDTLIFAKINPL